MTRDRLTDKQHRDAMRRLARLQTVADVLADVHGVEQQTTEDVDPQTVTRRLARLQAVSEVYRRGK